LETIPDRRVEEIFECCSGAEGWITFLDSNDPQAFIVIQDGKVRYENYFYGTRRDTIVTSFSVAKSFSPRKRDLDFMPLCAIVGRPPSGI
jgi:hypothetical protein